MFIKGWAGGGKIRDTTGQLIQGRKWGSARTSQRPKWTISKAQVTGLEENKWEKWHKPMWRCEGRDEEWEFLICHNLLLSRFVVLYI